MSFEDIMKIISGGLIVSCQAPEDNPMHGSVYMTAMALAAKKGGAVGIRANGVEDVAAIVDAVDLPVIGIFKRDFEDTPVRITPTRKEAKAIVAAGAEIIAVDGTGRPRHNGEKLADLIKFIQDDCDSFVMADISSLEEGLNAADLGADIVATTLSGYTGGPTPDEPDIRLVEDLAAKIDAPIIAEGRYWDPDQVIQAFEAGASAVVVGTSITNPMKITERFVKAIRKRA